MTSEGNSLGQKLNQTASGFRDLTEKHNELAHENLRRLSNLYTRVVGPHPEPAGNGMAGGNLDAATMRPTMGLVLESTSLVLANTSVLLAALESALGTPISQQTANKLAGSDPSNDYR